MGDTMMYEGDDLVDAEELKCSKEETTFPQ